MKWHKPVTVNAIDCCFNFCGSVTDKQTTILKIIVLGSIDILINAPNNCLLNQNQNIFEASRGTECDCKVDW